LFYFKRIVKIIIFLSKNKINFTENNFLARKAAKAQRILLKKIFLELFCGND